MNDQKQFTSLSDEVIHNFPTGIFVINPSGEMLIENPALKKTLGFDPESTNVGMELYRFIKSDPKLNQYLEDAANDKKTVKIENLTYTLHRDKNEIIINISIIPLVDEQKVIRYYFFLIEDVTKHALIYSKIHRQEKLSTIGIMASGVAEEIKWPLSHIMINLDFVEKNTSEDSPMRSYLQAIKDDLSRIRFVSKQMTDLSLPQTESNEDVCDVNKLFLSQPLKAKLNKIKERGITVKMSFPKKAAKVKANENNLIQAFTHIIRNASEAMPEEGTLTVIVESITEKENDIIAITITDTGMGIPEQNLPNIFKPFFSTKGRSGIGLGLMVAYSIVDNLGGAIGIKSMPGVGTSVRIVLPALSI
ncbi:MAG: ATP-binding protein [Spirochaetota bacterium]